MSFIWAVATGGGGGGASWGSITGTLSNQTDLQTALNLKAALAGPTFTGNVTVPDLLFTTDGVGEIGVDGDNRPAIVRVTDRILFGVNADASCPYAAVQGGGSDRLLFYAPGAQVSFYAHGNQIATFYDDGSLSTCQFDKGIVFGTADNTVDLGDFTGPGPNYQRPRNVFIGTALYIREGANATCGVATLVAGTVTVSTNKVTANSRIHLTVNNPGGTVGAPYVSARSNGVSFDITSTAGALDTSDVAWTFIQGGT